MQRIFELFKRILKIFKMICTTIFIISQSCFTLDLFNVIIDKQ